MVTLKQIAVLAGVSRGTVDRALHDRGGVRPEVAAEIRSIAREMGYTPDRAGKALSSHKNPTLVGVLLNSLGNPFFEPMITGMRQAESDYADFALRVLLRQTKGYEIRAQLEAINQLEAEGIRALVIAPINDPAVAKRLRALTQRGMPVVTVNSDIEGAGRTGHVGCNDRQSGETAACLMGLMTGGHACCAIVTGSIRMLGHSRRVGGFAAVCRRDYPGIKIAGVVENNDDDLASYHEVKRLIETIPGLDAFYFGAAGVGGGLRAIREGYHGRPAPRVVACDETPEIRGALRSGLVQATISQQPFEQGYRAVQTALLSAVNHMPPAQEVFFTQNEIKVKYNLSPPDAI